MALYTIHNKLNVRVPLPAPCDRSLGPRESVTLDLPSAIVDNTNSALSNMQSKGVITIVSDQSTSSSSVQVATVQVVNAIINRRENRPALADPSRFFNESSSPTIYVDPTNGSDVTGDGLELATAYQSVNRALKDLPNGWTSEVNVRVTAGTHTGNQNWILPVLPGARATSGTGRVAIIGDETVVETLTGGSAGAFVAGKSAQVDRNLGAFVTTVTDGSHFVKTPSASFLPSGTICRASTAPTMRMVDSVTTALTSPTLHTWSTIWSGTVTVQTSAPGSLAAHFFYVASMRFQAAVTARGVQFRVCRFDVATGALADVSRTSCVQMAGTVTWVGHAANLNGESATLYVAGSMAMTGNANSIAANVYAGAPSAPAKVCFGGVSATVTSAQNPAEIRIFSTNDFEGTGDCIRAIGSKITTQGAGTSTFAVTGGAAIKLYAGSVLYSAASWTGTAGAASLLVDGSMLLSNAGFAVTNGGSDITVGALATQAVTTRNTTDPTQLCRYT